MSQKRVGGRLCLDFANTVNAWPDPRRDDLTTPEGFAGWAADSGLALRSGPAAGELAAARRVRDAVRSVFTPLAAGREPDPDGLRRLLATAGDALSRANMVRVGSRFDVRWPPPCAVGDVLAAVAVSALEVLHHDRLDRIGECPSCHWLFLDTSRNGQRRWCDMDVCGARHKARTYYAARSRRHRAARS
jgi:predicted RNA-binding Zn ribbon-like protein